VTKLYTLAEEQNELKSRCVAEFINMYTRV